MKNKLLLCSITAITLLCIPALNFAQAPTLGTVANFVLFSSDGAVSNTGISQLTGNVGNNIGALGGFGNVNGVMHNADGATGQCAADLLIAYNQLNSAIPAFFPVSPVIGDGDTLVAGVYKLAAVTTLDSILYLNAMGDSNAVFIFQIQAAFSTNPNSKIILINAAQACNVFWKVEGAVGMGSATSMKGTIIANNDAVSMSVNDTLEGRALSTAGAITVNGVLAYTPVGCGSPLLTGPAAPDLASTACYAVFSGNGSVINAGISHVTGDIGTNVGLTGGFVPLMVNGTIHPIPDVSTAACSADLINVYNYLNTLPYDIELLYPAQFGNNLVLTPHTYLMAAATAFTDTVYLNAQGNANAIFVIQINGALTTSTFSNVVLTNGTQAKNVYWKVDGAVSIADSSVFNGTIVCNNAAISLTTGDSIYGRVLTTNGALSTASVSVAIPAGGCNVLPLSWLYFRGKPVQQNVLLEWGITHDINNGFFTIEKSRDGITFNTLGTITAIPGIINKEYDYSLTDQQPYNVTYYRISQTDENSRRNYFRTIQVHTNINPGLHVLHYVEDDHIYVQTSGAVPGNAYIELYSIDGKKIISQKITLRKEISTYKIEKALNKGIYLVNIVSQREKLYNGKIPVF